LGLHRILFVRGGGTRRIALQSAGREIEDMRTKDEGERAKNKGVRGQGSASEPDFEDDDEDEDE
jgi:hypothetical protein